MKTSSRYPEYKASGVEWLGEIPAHWQVKRLKHAVHLNPDTLSETTDPVYALQYLDIGNVEEVGGINPPQAMHFADAPSRARRRVLSGDTIISTVRTYLKAIAHFENPPDNLIVSTGFAVLRPTAQVAPKFLHALVRCGVFVEKVVAHSAGVGYPAINPTELSCLPVWLPPLEEQSVIAEFLDRETAKIDELVAKKERLIELLQEKRTALISHAVTKGLTPEVPMKDSGVEWLGQIPAHWSVKKGRYIGTLLSYEGEPGSGPRENHSVVYLKVDELNRPGDGIYLKCLEERRRAPNGSDGAEDEIIVFPKRGAAIFTNKVRIARGAVMLDPNVMGWRVFRQNDTRYVALALWVRKLTDLADVSSVPQINNKHIYPAKFPIPPVDEQRAITAHLDHVTAKLDALIAKIRTSIERLQEYRTALISAAVTGKIDVRQPPASASEVDMPVSRPRA